MAARPLLEFWYDPASTYAYLSAMRIPAMASAAGVEVVWRPFLLGPVFAAQGWSTSPFNLWPAKGRYMRRDLERLAEARGLRFMMPPVFPANSLLAARVACAVESEGLTPKLSIALFEAAFARGEDIGEPAVIARTITGQGLDATHLMARCATPEIKQTLRERTEQAMRHGIFGAPTFRTIDGDLFWGDDRLEMALRAAAKAVDPDTE